MARYWLNDGLNNQGTLVLEESSIDEMKQARGQTATSADYGITLFQDRYKDSTVYYHPGSAAPYATCLMIHPDSGFGVVVLMNIERNHLRRQISETILDFLCE